MCHIHDNWYTLCVVTFTWEKKSSKHINMGSSLEDDTDTANTDVFAIKTLSCVEGLKVKKINVPKIFQSSRDDTEVKGLIATTIKHEAAVQKMSLFDY